MDREGGPCKFWKAVWEAVGTDEYSRMLPFLQEPQTDERDRLPTR